MVVITEEENKVIVVIDIKNSNDFLLFSPEYFKEMGINYIDSYIKMDNKEKKSEIKEVEEEKKDIVENVVKTPEQNPIQQITENILKKSGGSEDDKKRVTIPYRYFVYLLSGKEPTDGESKEKKSYVFNLINGLFKTKIYDKKPEEKKWFSPINKLFKSKEKESEKSVTFSDRKSTRLNSSH